ncbi:hypothetical protein MCOR27_004462 [Pyricularia oryzae]|uniref:Prokaryotic-type class I peptide chain release factors domain-containing protein n=1 Tax=Pyricularia grisea TaxID=148305 RepID=A0ABQ8NG52_PYRGI|nr:hypothetical protein MCOR01_001025 [Pyricularia oryzae]KAI6295967.1 hypothetical protein MCOR33_007266 [Pyricularia grisea]KAH9430459.1 hypothetical protein MCOR02_010160 [Pyricularia oryzae]KAI6255139.1 hypothetical protein MCOR19_008349 [Pyricularia oryzae]KAI6271036.1 hypothetical protein MCOR26_007988 [Pyricularia oryzae]
MLRAPWLCRRLIRPSQWRTTLTTIKVTRRLASTEASGRIPPALLLRARNLTDEHDQLHTELEANFDSTKAKRMGEISKVADALKAWDAAQASINELTGLSKSQDEEMRELAKEELETTNNELGVLSDKIKIALTPKHPFADMPCLIEFRPGPGGMEGRLFTDALFKMYQSYCTFKGYRTKTVTYERVDGPPGADGETPLQEAILEVINPGSYDIFRGEAGMHRVQRVPATEKSGRIHTSAAAVWVLPSFPEEAGASDEGTTDVNDPNSDFYIDPTEVRVETMRARGAGGQHVNKTESAIRLTHMPTGTMVSMQDERSQQRNREAAWKVLRSRIAQKRREQREEMAQNLRSSVLSKDKITRGEKIRTYNYVQKRCTDHRSGLDIHNLPGVMMGGPELDRIIASVHEWQTARDVRLLIAEEEEAAAAAAKDTGGNREAKK